jgi:hypothetical protein
MAAARSSRLYRHIFGERGPNLDWQPARLPLLGGWAAGRGCPPGCRRAVNQVGRLHRLLPPSESGRAQADTQPIPAVLGRGTSRAGLKPRQDGDATATSGAQSSRHQGGAYSQSVDRMSHEGEHPTDCGALVGDRGDATAASGQ